MDSGLGPFSANSLRTCAPVGALDVLKCDFLLHRQLLIFPTLSGLGWCGWSHLLVKIEAQLEYLSLFHILDNQVSSFLLERAHVFPSLL